MSTLAPEKGEPDNPRNWNPDDPTLDGSRTGYDETSPHELPAILRMHRNGWPGPKILEHFKANPMRFQRDYYKGLGDENRAAAANRPMHSGWAPKGYK